MTLPEVRTALLAFQREEVIGEITVYKPEPPKNYKDIANWDLPAAKQYFTYTEQPPKNQDPTE